MTQVARNLTDSQEGFLTGQTHLLMDRDAKFSAAFRETLQAAAKAINGHQTSGIESVLLPPRSPNLNAYMERFMRSVKSECLDRMIFFGEPSLRRAVHEYQAHYHAERNHQGLENRLIEPDTSDQCDGAENLPPASRERLGGLLKFYHRPAA